ncbi:MAG: HPr(Ser) kinase/phosphatase [Clostridiales bacterium]|nr:HPr(Ser) kinase/phosphatase [Clostridiales bacterium]
MSTVLLTEIIEEFNLINFTPDIDMTEMYLEYPDINRPALQLAGFFEYFDSNRLQIIGLVEHAYLSTLSEDIRSERLRHVFTSQIPCLILTRKLEPFPEMFVYAEYYKIPVLGSDSATTEFMGEIIKWLRVRLAPQVTLHGVLVDIYGEGVLLMGDSGIGKSEAALELIKRGHRLVADDAVEVKRVSAQTLIGSCPELIKYFIELRGIGIIDVRQMFGVEAIKATQNIDLVIKLELWDEKKEYDRLGLTEEYIDILGNKVVCHSIPIRPGRNLAIICESAAVNHRQKKMGYNAAQVLNERVIENMNK